MRLIKARKVFENKVIARWGSRCGKWSVF